jgi:hypothetical protein
VSNDDHKKRREIADRIAQSMARRLPPTHKFQTELEYHRRFTWQERLRILMGYCIRIEIRIAHLHNPGSSAAMCTVATTEEVDQTQEAAR